jgi:hypothetical protein
MSEKMPEKTKAVLLNVCIVGTLVWFYYSGYPYTLVIAGFISLMTANVLMYVKGRRLR